MRHDKIHLSHTGSTGSAGSVGRLVAVLGPTNTGKTYLAMERMLAHETGMIGFPLRLLARENYDKVVRLKGSRAVALVTGEEKIIPPSPRYWVCTVESMPLDRPVRFLCIDEIQLCADPERGHIFTDRLLHARGSEETMFLGADTIKPLLTRLVPRVEVIARPRFSQLTFSGHKKLARLPPRSAIVAFSVTDVYALAEMVRRSRGGTAVVMGALSPRTRNAQVAMYQAGDVDYLVATDAIGMGLNMDVDHVWFARLTKFDGHQPRRLRPPEVAQIAGRAGRYQSNGGFGTSWDSPPLDAETVEAVETHSFQSLTQLMWRNADLDFRSVDGLLRSLEARPFAPELIRTREADDHVALQHLAKDPELAGLVSGRSAVGLLWEVCQVPDFRKTMTDAHTRLLSQLFVYLRAPGGRLPDDFVAVQVERLNRTEGDIDTLVARIAHVRTWTYIAHRADWVRDPAHWQGMTRTIEDRLSDALHERLTQRFVDKRSAGLVKRLRDGGELLAAVTASGAVLVEGHPVGELKGFRFGLDAEVQADDQRAIMTAVRRALRDELARRLGQLEAASDADIQLSPPGTLDWGGAALATLTAGPSPFRPQVRLSDDALSGDLLDGPQRDRVKARLTAWVQATVSRRLAPLLALAAANLTGAARGIAFQVVEALGVMARAPLDPLITDLDDAGHRQLHRLGLRFGLRHVFLSSAIRPDAVALRGLLLAVWRGLPLPLDLPAPGLVSITAPIGQEALFAAIGYPVCGPRAIRVDMLDRLLRLLEARGQAGTLMGTDDLPPIIGCSAQELVGLLESLGWRQGTMPGIEGGPDQVIWLRAATVQARRQKRPRSEGVGAAEHPFAVLRHLAGR